MKKFFFQSIVGSFSTLSGFASGYVYIDGLRIKANHMMLGIALLLITVGIFFLRKAMKTGNPFSQRLDPLPATSTEAGFEGKLQKNNDLMKDWAKTMKTRDELKVMQIAESAKEQAASNQ